MNILDRILELREEKGWSEYKLSVESGIPQSTISSWYRKNAQPSVASLEAICTAFDIPMSQFFADDTDSAMCLSATQRSLLKEFSHLDNEQQRALVEFLRTFKHEL